MRSDAAVSKSQKQTADKNDKKRQQEASISCSPDGKADEDQPSASKKSRI
jgi:hypothetical protein